MNSQIEFIAATSTFDDSAREWQIYYYDSEKDREERATLYLKWPFRNDWTEWSVDLQDEFYTIKQRYQIAPQQWELTGGGISVTIRQKWLGDINEWVISYNNENIKWQTETPNNLELWYMELEEGSYLDMWTHFPGDSRDWDIEDRAATLPKEVKIAAIFTTVYLTTPKY